MENKNIICQLGNSSYIQMMGYVIRTADGKLIVIDGGREYDAENLIETAKRLSGKDLPRVDAWFLTHAHSDHLNALFDILENRPGALEIEKLYYCFPSLQFVEKTEPNEAHTLAKFLSFMPKIYDKCVTVTEGDIYDIGEAHIEVLYTQDPTFRHNSINNSSSVLKFTLGGRDILFLGDLGVEGGEKLLANHKDALPSEYCQLAHHGQNGVSREVYEAISPRVCLWCAPDWLYNNDSGKGFNTSIFQTVEVRGWMDELGASEHIVEMNGNFDIIL